MSTDVELAPNAVSERGGVIRHTEKEVDLALRMVILNGGRLKNASMQLKEEGFEIHRNTLREWRDRQFPRRYAQLRNELNREVTEEIAGRALERALQADEAEQTYIEQALAKVGEVDPNHLAKNALALANAKGQNIEKAQLLRDRPTQIVEDRSLGELVKALEHLGVAKREAPEEIECDAEEIE